MVGMVLIDLKKAFDTVDGEILLQKLSAMGITSLEFGHTYLTESNVLRLVVKALLFFRLPVASLKEASLALHCSFVT